MHRLSDGGINIIGRLNEQSGTSIAAHAVVRALQSHHIRLAYHQLAAQPLARDGEPVDIRQQVCAIDHLPYRATLVLDVPFIVNDLYMYADHFRDIYRIGTVVYWELEHFPTIWHQTYASIDVAFAPSTLVQTALSRATGIPPPMLPIVPIDIDFKPRAALDGRPFKFFTHFDVMSSIARKNAQAAIAAFIEAFGKRNDVRLVVKVWEGKGNHVDHARLLSVEREYPSIQHIFGNYSYMETRALIASADAYVSLHRSEGLGLGMLEAMAAGVPVIATDYGGNTDYLDDRCGFPIPYTMISTEGSDEIYSRSYVGTASTWADPDVSYAASAMQQIVADRRGYARLAQAARKRYEGRAHSFKTLQWLTPLYESLPKSSVINNETEAQWNLVR